MAKTFQEIQNEFLKNLKIKARKTSQPLIIGIIGTVGSGRTTISKKIEELADFTRIEKDYIRILLREYGPGFDVKTSNQILSKAVHKIIKEGGNALIDADFAEKETRERLEKEAKKLGAKVFYIRTFTEPDTLFKRLIKAKYNPKRTLFRTPEEAVREMWRQDAKHYTSSKSSKGKGWTGWTKNLKKFQFKNIIGEIDTTGESKEEHKKIIEKIK